MAIFPLTCLILECQPDCQWRRRLSLLSQIQYFVIALSHWSAQAYDAVNTGTIFSLTSATRDAFRFVSMLTFTFALRRTAHVVFCVSSAYRQNLQNAFNKILTTCFSVDSTFHHYCAVFVKQKLTFAYSQKLRSFLGPGNWCNKRLGRRTGGYYMRRLLFRLS